VKPLRALAFAALLYFNGHPWVVDALAQGMCDAAVLTAIDSSASIDRSELAVEIDGMAFAIQSPELMETIRHGKHGCITMAAFIWATNAPVVVLSWTVISNEEEARQAAAALKAIAASLQDSPVGHGTDTSTALTFAYQMFAQPNVMTPRQILNLITDDQPNTNAQNVPAARAALLAAGAQINGVAIGGDMNLTDYLSSQIVGGKGAFVMAITKADNMAAAMVSKFRLDVVSAH
jgi:uncharacterized membrane protein